MSIPLTISFGSDFDAAAAGVTRDALEAGAQAGWAEWTAFIGDSRVAAGASFEIEIRNDSTAGFVASIYGGSVEASELPGTTTRLQHELITGEDANGTTADAIVYVGSSIATVFSGVTGVFAHEFGHALGFTYDAGASVFARFVSGTDFVGPAAVADYGGPVPILQDGYDNHIASPAASRMGGNSTVVTSLDAAILTDIGVIGSHTTGTSGGDVMSGSYSADTLSGGAGDDQITGSYGADLIYGNRGADAVFGNQGADTVLGGQDADILFGGQDADVAYGNLADDALYGNLGADVLYGGQGADTLYGGQGDDVLFGNVGNDVLLPGLGADTVQPGGGGDDTVVGFDGDGGDRLALSSLTWSLGSTTGGDAVLSYAGGSVTLVGVSSVRVSSAWLL